MTATFEEMKQEAIRRLEALEVFKPYISKFKSKASIPTYFERFGGFYADQEPELMCKIREVEASGDYLVYAITHEYVQSFEMWAMLIVSNDKSCWADEFSPYAPGSFYAFSYVYNATDPQLSELGDVVVRSSFGGLARLY